MAKAARRGPKKGKRLTPEIQSALIVEALYSKKSLVDVVDSYKKKGYNIKKEVEEDLKNISASDISFMLANKEILQSIKEEAIKSIINNITKPKPGTA